MRLDEETTVTVLWPPRAETGYDSLSVNDSSLVLRLECAGLRTLLPGDIEHLGQQLLLELGQEDLRADVLVLPHHGSHTPALEQFIAAVDPDVVIRSSGWRRTGAAEQIRALTVNRRFFATDANGCVTVRFANSGPQAVGFRQTR